MAFFFSSSCRYKAWKDEEGHTTKELKTAENKTHLRCVFRVVIVVEGVELSLEFLFDLVDPLPRRPLRIGHCLQLLVHQGDLLLDDLKENKVAIEEVLYQVISFKISQTGGIIPGNGVVCVLRG